MEKADRPNGQGQGPPHSPPPTSHPPARSVGSSCPTVHLSDLTLAGRRKCLLLEGMPEGDQEMQENGQPERVMSKASRRGSQDTVGQSEGAKATGSEEEREGAAFRALSLKGPGSAQGGTAPVTHRHRDAALQF